MSTKQEYITAWRDHIMILRTLQFVPDHAVGKKIQKHIDELLKLVPKIAELKQLED